MARSRTSNAWLREHVNDHYVHLAKAGGWRSRAAFKLMEIDDRDRLLKPGSTVVDLGAAPGGWSQLAAQRIGPQGRVFALDLLEMPPIPGVRFIQGDFREASVLEALSNQLGTHRVDLVISDMSPNISGVSTMDQARAMHLCELALEFAGDWLQPEGAFLVKVFQGADSENFMRTMKMRFQTVQSRKPKASRDRSPEIYLLGRTLR